MPHFLILSAFCFLAGFLNAQDAVEESVHKNVEIKLSDQSWFTDRVGEAVVHFDSIVEQPETWTESSAGCEIIDIEVIETPDNKLGQSMALIRFRPTATGTVNLPALEFIAGNTAYDTQPMGFFVSEPRRSEEMTLNIKPEKLEIFAGEPLRLELVWDCSLPSGALRALDLRPEFFNEEGIEAVVARNTAEEAKQMGMPIGGRRVIATRTLSETRQTDLGHIELPIYLRFDEPRTYTINPVRLEVTELKQSSSAFGRYSAYFNNELFEAVDSGERYERLFTTSAPIEIIVRPLPAEGQDTEFSDLFMPMKFDVSVSPEETEIGQLMELEIKVSGKNPHGMIVLPPLSHQPGLRGKFLVDDHTESLWHENGSIFRTRIRALTTSIQAFPSLKFQVFDPDHKTFKLVTTPPILLTVKPSKGRDFIPLKSYDGAAVKLTKQPKGVWHNLQAKPLNDFMNTLYQFLIHAFWPLLFLGPVAFSLLLPVVKERHRRATDPRYRSRVAAFRRLKKTPSDSPEKWKAFLEFMATSFDHREGTWTAANSTAAMRSIGAESEQIEKLNAMHAQADAHEFSKGKPDSHFLNLDQIAKGIAAKIITCTVFFLLATSLPSFADEWSEAEGLFSKAQTAQAGSDAANALYSETALKFQAVANSNIRPGEAWTNSGNAWFQAGATGRAIAAYREASVYRPFDSRLSASLEAARALVLNDVATPQTWWKKIPSQWAKVALVLINLLFWGALLLTFRYRRRAVLITTIALGICLLISAVYVGVLSLYAKQEGVIIVDAAYARKGPGNSYANAFNEALHEGLEFTLIENRDDWAFIELSDSRKCWILKSQAQWLH